MSAFILGQSHKKKDLRVNVSPFLEGIADNIRFNPQSEISHPTEISEISNLNSEL